MSKRLRRPRRPLTLRGEQLEDRRVLATFYLDDNYLITNDQGAAGLDAGDEVTWGVGSAEETAGLIFGTNAFGAFLDALGAAGDGDTIKVGEGTFLFGGPALQINSQVTIDGLGSDVTEIRRSGGPSGNFDEMIHINADNVTIQDVHLAWQEPAASDGQGYVVITYGDATTISSVLFDGNYRSAVVLAGSNDSEISDSRFAGLWGRGAIRDANAGAGERFLITRNTFEEDHFRWGPVNFELGGVFSGEISFNYFLNGVQAGFFQEAGDMLSTVTFAHGNIGADGVQIFHNTFDWQDSNVQNGIGNYPQPTAIYYLPGASLAPNALVIRDNIFRGYEYVGPQPGGGPQWHTAGGVFGGALEFDGVDDFGVFKDPVFDIGEQGTMTLWMNLDTLGKRHMLGGGAVEFQVRHSNDVYFYPGNLGSDNTLIWSSDTVSSGVWTHVAYTWDHSLQEGRIYLDGVEVNYRASYDPNVSPSWTQIVDTIDELIYIGRDPGNPGSRDFDGKMDDLGFFDEVLTPAEILDIINNGVAANFAADPRLVAHWDFDQAAGDIAVDNKNGIQMFIVTDGVSPLDAPVFQPGSGQFGGALEFNGSGGFATFQDATFDIGQRGTLNFWVNLHAPGKRNQFFEGPENGGMEFQYRSNGGGQFYGRTQDNGEFVIQSGGAGVIANTWTNIQYTWDNTLGEMRIYINGTEVAYLGGFDQNIAGFDLLNFTNTAGGLMNVGRDPGDAGRFLDGLLDDIAWYDDVLSSTELDDVRLNGASAHADLVAHWNLDDAPGTMIASGNSGTTIDLYIQQTPPVVLSGYALNVPGNETVDYNVYFKNDVHSNQPLGPNDIIGDPLFFEQQPVPIFYQLQANSPAANSSSGLTPDAPHRGANQEPAGVAVIDGTPGGDEFVVQLDPLDNNNVQVLIDNVLVFTSPLAGISHLTLNGLAGDDSFLVLDDLQFGGSQLETLVLNGNDDEDTFGSVADPIFPQTLTSLYIDGGSPSAPATPGDTLILDTSTAPGPVIIDTVGGNVFTGGTAPFSFTEIESVIATDVPHAPPINFGDLYVRDTDEGNRIILYPVGSNEVRVRIDSTYFGPYELGPGGRVIVLGEGGDDQITVAGRWDHPVYFDGGDGNDYLAAGTGNDELYGGDGNDRIHGGQEGDDLIFGGAGKDTIQTGDGMNVVYGDGDGVTVIVPPGEGGDDSIIGGDGNDELHGGEGNDNINGRYGNDLIFGDEGNDSLSGYHGNDVLVGGEGNDKLYGGNDDDILLGGLGVDLLRGDAGDDLLIGDVTTHDANNTALLALLAEWSSGTPLATRVANLMSGGGLAAGFMLTWGGTVTADGAKDDLTGSSGADWFFQFNLGTANEDKLRDFKPADDELTDS